MRGKSDKLTEVPERFDPDFFDQMDGRTVTARALRTRLHALVTDLGGAENVSAAKFALLRRVCHVEAIAESLEERIANGDIALLDAYLRAVSTLRNLLATTGLERRSKKLGLADVLRGNNA